MSWTVKNKRKIVKTPNRGKKIYSSNTSVKIKEETYSLLENVTTLRVFRKPSYFHTFSSYVISSQNTHFPLGCGKKVLSESIYQVSWNTVFTAGTGKSNPSNLLTDFANIHDGGKMYNEITQNVKTLFMFRMKFRP